MITRMAYKSGAPSRVHSRIVARSAVGYSTGLLEPELTCVGVEADLQVRLGGPEGPPLRTPTQVSSGVSRGVGDWRRESPRVGTKSSGLTRHCGQGIPGWSYSMGGFVPNGIAAAWPKIPAGVGAVAGAQTRYRHHGRTHRQRDGSTRAADGCPRSAGSRRDDG
jgi:hypothetical protein